MRNTVPTAYTTVPTGVTVCSGHDPGITGHVEPEYSQTAYLRLTVVLVVRSPIWRPLPL